jgi:hypothetical protein
MLNMAAHISHWALKGLTSGCNKLEAPGIIVYVCMYVLRTAKALWEAKGSSLFRVWGICGERSWLG